VSRGALEQTAEARVGSVIGDAYRVQRFLGESSFGPLYDGERIADGRRVNIKLLSDARVQNLEVVARVRLECDLLRRLAHPNLVDVLDVGATASGEPFLVTEQLAGATLAERLARSGALPTSESLRIASRAASALSAAHRQGIVHAALRPHDIFLARSEGEPDTVKLLGFGLGRLDSEQSRVTVRLRPGAAYFAPEQLKSRARVDHRVDQFSLATICYEMLTGSCPFAAENPSEVAQRLLELEPEAPSRVAAGVPTAVDSVLLRALRKDPMDRYPNISQLGQALENATAAASIRARSRRPTPSTPSGATGAYRVRPGDTAHAQTEPAPAYLDALRAAADLRPPARSTTPEPAPRPNAGSSDAYERARRLAARARESARGGALDAAVAHAEKLFAHALLHQADARVLEVLRTHFTLLDRIFAQRLGELDRRVLPGPTSEGSARPELAPAAHALLDAARSGSTLRELVERSRMPRRDAIRLLAGLMRRGVIRTESAVARAPRK
jgi:serine/threonine protein kinase